MMRKTSKSTLVTAAAFAAASLLAAPAALAEPNVNAASTGGSVKIAARSGDPSALKAEHAPPRYQGHDDKRKHDNRNHPNVRDQRDSRDYRNDRDLSGGKDYRGINDRDRDRDRRRDDRADNRRDHDHRDFDRNRSGHDTRHRDYRDWGDDRRGGQYANRGRNGRTALITCSSGDYRVQRCNINVGFQVRDARVHKMRSRADCIRGRDWNINGRTLWVKDGCRAVFEVSATMLPGNRRWTDNRYSGSRTRDPWGHDHYHNRTYPGVDNRSAIRIAANRQAIQACLRRGSQVAWNQSMYNEGYAGVPKIKVGRRGKLHVTGKMRVEGRNGYGRLASSRCVVNNGYVEEFVLGR